MRFAESVCFQLLTALLAAWTGSGAAGSPEAAAGEVAEVPEPSTLVLALLATLGVAAGWRRRRRRV